MKNLTALVLILVLFSFSGCAEQERLFVAPKLTEINVKTQDVGGRRF